MVNISRHRQMINNIRDRQLVIISRHRQMINSRGDRQLVIVRNRKMVSIRTDR
jgi:hypothetical protein